MIDDAVTVSDLSELITIPVNKNAKILYKLFLLLMIMM